MTQAIEALRTFEMEMKHFREIGYNPQNVQISMCDTYENAKAAMNLILSTINSCEYSIVEPMMEGAKYYSILIKSPVL